MRCNKYSSAGAQLDEAVKLLERMLLIINIMIYKTIYNIMIYITHRPGRSWTRR